MMGCVVLGEMCMSVSPKNHYYSTLLLFFYCDLQPNHVLKKRFSVILAYISIAKELYPDISPRML